jgi:hypothetical protein
LTAVLLRPRGAAQQIQVWLRQPGQILISPRACACSASSCRTMPAPKPLATMLRTEPSVLAIAPSS